MTEAPFKNAYEVLQRHSEALRNQREPNIDDLLTIVTESVTAYKVCGERIDAVQKALEEALSGTGAAQSSSPATPGTDEGSSDPPRSDLCYCQRTLSTLRSDLSRPASSDSQPSAHAQLRSCQSSNCLVVCSGTDAVNIGFS